MGVVAPLRSPSGSDVGVPPLSLNLLGGFSVRVNGIDAPESAWKQRRAAKHLLKLLALAPNHALHREQILVELWPDDELAVALAKFSKALHTARRALEPDLTVRGASSYLHMQDDILSLESDRLEIDVSRFRFLAERALRTENIADCKASILAYQGDLLPEDRYEGWASGHRDMLAELLIEVYLTTAKAYERQGGLTDAVQCLRHAERMDSTREEIHRHLMRLYAQLGKRHQALRQYQTCRDILEQDLGVVPDAETERLHAEILAGRLTGQDDGATASPGLPNPTGAYESIPLLGRARVLGVLMNLFEQAKHGHGGTVFISGEVGVGKSRLVTELMARAATQGAVVMRGAGYMMDSVADRYDPLVQALESYISHLPLHQRQDIAARHPELAWLVPSLANPDDLDRPAPDTAHLLAATAGFLRDLAESQPVVLVLRDLHAADSATVSALEYLVHRAGDRRWLLVGTFREEDIPSDSLLPSLLMFAARDGLSTRIELRRLARADADELVRLSLEGDTIDPVLLDYVYETSLGNPLFVLQIITTLVEQKQIALDAGVWKLKLNTPALVPPAVSDLMAVRLSQFDETVQRVLELAATAGPSVTFVQIRDGVRAFGESLSDAEMLRALDRALEARLLEECEDGYAFTHPLFRAGVNEQLSRHRREQLRAALNGTEFARAWPSSPPGTGAEWEPGHRLLPWEAAGKYGREVDALDAQGCVEESAASRQKLAAALIAMGRYERALSVLRQANDIYTGLGDDAGCARIAAQMELLRFASSQ